MKSVSVLALTGLCLSLAAYGGKGESDESATASAAASAVASAAASDADRRGTTRDRLEALRKKNMHKYAAKAITHYNPVFL